MKKYISYSIMSVILLALLGLILFLQIPRITYKYSDYYNGYMVSAVYGNSCEYTIPNEYKNKPVVGIANKAFEKQTKMNKLNILEDSNIVVIEQLAFYNCSSLKSINIPKNVKCIESNAFLGCSSLTSVTFASNSKLEKICGSAFFDCINLTEVKLPIDISYEIGDYAFYNTNINKLIVSKNVITYDNSFIGIDNNKIIFK